MTSLNWINRFLRFTVVFRRFSSFFVVCWKVSVMTADVMMAPDVMLTRHSAKRLKIGLDQWLPPTPSTCQDRSHSRRQSSLQPQLEKYVEMITTDSVIQAFHAHDVCCLSSDKFLLTMVYIYFNRAKLPITDYNRYEIISMGVSARYQNKSVKGTTFLPLCIWHTTFTKKMRRTSGRSCPGRWDTTGSRD